MRKKKAAEEKILSRLLILNPESLFTVQGVPLLLSGFHRLIQRICHPDDTVQGIIFIRRGMIPAVFHRFHLAGFVILRFRDLSVRIGDGLGQMQFPDISGG